MLNKLRRVIHPVRYKSINLTPLRNYWLVWHLTPVALCPFYPLLSLPLSPQSTNSQFLSFVRGQEPFNKLFTCWNIGVRCVHGGCMWGEKTALGRHGNYAGIAPDITFCAELAFTSGKKRRGWNGSIETRVNERMAPSRNAKLDPPTPGRQLNAIKLPTNYRCHVHRRGKRADICV